MSDIYKMELHETIVLDDKLAHWTHIQRVAGGWIYMYFQQNSATGDYIIMGNTFVPFHNEFQPTQPQPEMEF